MIALRTLDIITIVVPPALPAAMTVGTVYAQVAITNLRIVSDSFDSLLQSLAVSESLTVFDSP